MSRPHEILSRYLHPGQVIARRYRLERLLGQGAYAVVYEACDELNHDRVAIKALPPLQDSASSTAIERFKREMEIARHLAHPNIVTLFDVGETPEGVTFMVMELIKGRTLEQRVRHAPMDLDEGLEVFAQIASALKAAHRIGVVHRDLKPANIMLGELERGEVQVKMLDFGMAKALEQLGEQTLAALTREGVTVGTPRYIAPEQANGKAIGPYTDLYALGLLGYEIFTGERAVKRDDISGAVAAHVSPKPLELPELGRVPAPLKPVLTKLMNKRPELRYQTATALLLELDAMRAARRVARRGPLQAPSQLAPQGHAGRPGAPGGVLSALDIDHERLEQAVELEAQAKRQSAEERPRRQALVESAPRRGARAPGHALRVIESALMPAIVLVSFTFLTAHIGVTHDGLRAALGLSPFLVAGLAGWVIADHVPALHPARAVNLTALLLLVASHLFDLGTLKTHLMLKPAWYLAAVREVPGLEMVHRLIEQASRHYVELISMLG